LHITFVKVEVFIPEQYIETLRNSLNDLGVLQVGNYDHVVSYTMTKGYWRPLQASNPYNGVKDEISYGSECKLEFRCPYKKIEEVMKIIKTIHPYEEPMIYIIPLLDR